MARVTVEDCVDKVENRFELVLLAGHRARQIFKGTAIAVERSNDKNPVVALREIAEDAISPEDLKEDFIHSLQKHVEIDESDTAVKDLLEDSDSLESKEFNFPEQTFDEFSEEELLSAIENLVTPEKHEDY